MTKHLLTIVLLLFVPALWAQEQRSIDVDKMNQLVRELEAEILLLNDWQSARTNEISILTFLAESYQKPFETLLETATLASVARDKEIIEKYRSDDSVTLKKINDLFTYKQAEQLLSFAYNKEAVSAAMEQLSAMDVHPAIAHLIQLLDKFQMCSNGLKRVFENIHKNDTLESFGNEVIRDEKWRDISLFLFSYGVDLDAYPFFRKKIFELLMLKTKDIDADISYLLNDL